VEEEAKGGKTSPTLQEEKESSRHRLHVEDETCETRRK
jgi:hypothetical protein